MWATLEGKAGFRKNLRLTEEGLTGMAAADLSRDDLRFMPVLTAPEAAFYLGIPSSTLYHWVAWGHRLVTYVRQDRRKRPTIPFIGLAEAYAVSAFRKRGVPMQRIWPALEQIRERMGMEHALASSRLHTDGAEILWEIGEREDEFAPVKDLVVVRNDQYVFTDAIREYLECIRYDMDGWASTLRLKRFGEVPVIVDPQRAFGRPMIDAYGGVRVEDIIDLFEAGESPADIAAGYRVPLHVAESVIESARQAA
jgi:uncharacterized protein (DUF433 family)